MIACIEIRLHPAEPEPALAPGQVGIAREMALHPGCVELGVVEGSGPLGETAQHANERAAAGKDVSDFAELRFPREGERLLHMPRDIGKGLA